MGTMEGQVRRWACEIGFRLGNSIRNKNSKFSNQRKIEEGEQVPCKMFLGSKAHQD